MNSDFDKEMDIWLRRTARQADFAPETVSAEHLDADGLAAFVENSLPASARKSFVAHLADCGDCRAVLSNLILINEAEQEEPAAIATEKTVPQTSWLAAWRKIFAIPQYGFAAAALSLLLVGVVAFVALRDTNQRELAKVEQAEFELAESAARSRPPARPNNEPRAEEDVADAAPSPEDTLANANMSATPENSPTPEESAPAGLPPSYTATTGRGANRNAAPADTVAVNKQANSNSPNAADSATGGAARPVVSAPAAPLTESVARTEPTTQPKPAPPAAVRERDNDEAKKDDADTADITSLSTTSRNRAAQNPAARAVATRTVGGKTFQQIGGVWIDSAYNSQTAARVARNSDEYKKLDAGLRSIAEKFSGEVVVVWQGKAYRIR